MDFSEEQINALFLAVFGGSVKAQKLPQELYDAINFRLMDAVDRGFGDGDEVGDMYSHFQRNIGVFSAAKTHQQVVDMSKALVDENGIRKSFPKFKKEAREIFDEYNVNWLETEYRTAFNNGLSARQWLDFQEDKDFAPMLRYDTAGDGRVRPQHAELDGIIRHIDDPFWETHFPPLDWNCRCDVTAYEEDEVEATPDDILKDLPEPDDLFRFNPAIAKIIFDEAHPYLKVAQRYKTLKKEDFGLDLPPKP